MNKLHEFLMHAAVFTVCTAVAYGHLPLAILRWDDCRSSSIHLVVSALLATCTAGDDF